MNNQIDLLPPWARNEKNKRQRIKILIATQIFIFLLLAFFIFLLSMYERQLWNRSRELSGIIAAFDSAPFEIAERLQSAYISSDYIEERVQELIPAEFENEWLDIILLSMPRNAELTRMEFSGREISIVCDTGDINLIETHHINLSEFFTYVRQGRIMRTDDEYFSYELRVFVGEE